jgi:4-amino-4-deoxy-L-arabinose transferase-like glycosyltransferase
MAVVPLDAWLQHYTEVLSRSWLIVPLLLLYLLHLGGVGFLGPDEPRYASIGREMAHSGDLVTPRLDGQPWFEKPPLLYWMIAAGHRLRLPDEWAARLLMPLASIAFLLFFYKALERQFHARLAFLATAILATSVGWLAYSFTALTDLPMSAALGAAMLITLFDTRPMPVLKNRGWLAGALLGLAILGKGLVPVVLFAPLLLIARGKRIGIVVGAIIVAAPWHVLCWMQNGSAFWNDYFWKQHVSRFFSPDLQHVQPFWYYLPVILAGLFPWTPLAGLLARRKLYEDVRVRLLAGWVIYGLLFFSIARNKLPGYVLPLMPAIAIVLAVALDKAPRKEWWLAACAALLIALPSAAAVLPEALLSGLSRAHVVFAWGGLVFLVAAVVVWWLASHDQREIAVLAVVLAAAIGIVYVKYTTFPVLDRDVSVRAFVRENKTLLERACIDDATPRYWEYGLNYYVGRKMIVCEFPVGPVVDRRDGRLRIDPGRETPSK